MNKIICGIAVDVQRRNVKSVRIKIDRDLNVSLIIPSRCSERAGVEFFIAKEKWVRQKLSQTPSKCQIEIKSGETLFVLGKPYKVVVLPSVANNCFIKGEEIVFYAKDSRQEYLIREYERLLKKVLLAAAEEYFKKWEDVTGLKKSSLSIRKTVSRWGSCNSMTGAISLCLFLACLPEICLDYVVLHELCHLRYANHGVCFKRELDKYMPNWREVRRFLKEKANLYLYR